MTYSLGVEVTHNGKSYLVVGIVDAEHLYELAPASTRVEVEWERYREKYVCLKDLEGGLEFITLTEDSWRFERTSEQISALPHLPWRRQ